MFSCSLVMFTELVRGRDSQHGRTSERLSVKCDHNTNFGILTQNWPQLARPVYIRDMSQILVPSWGF